MPRISTRKALLVALLTALPAVLWLALRERSAPPAPAGGAAAGPSTQAVAALAAERARLDGTVWADEVLAQQYEEPFIRLWDDLRRAAAAPPAAGRADPSAVLERFPFETLILGEPAAPERLEAGVVRTPCGGPGRRLDSAAWRALLARWKEEGLRLEQSEWHHSRFQPPRGADPARSTVAFVLHAVREREPRRYIVKGNLEVEWAGAPPGSPVPRVVDATRVEILERAGEPPFREFGAVPLTGEEHPLLVYDLDGNGLPEILLPGVNRFYRLQGGKLEGAVLLAHPPPEVTAALLADFNADGDVDLFCAAEGHGAPWLFFGTGGGRFDAPPARLDGVGDALRVPLAITAGDVDADGDLDVWLSQYRAPYWGGQMPTPYYDANDGFPSFLLVNDGQGRFSDGTAAAGLEAKRRRRTYSASFADLDGDGDQDLLVVADFAGVDAWENDGRGRFTDVSDRWFRPRNTFGMSHVFADFNLDGRLDVYVVGMSSTTARRLEALGLGRPEFPDHQILRPLMGYGNRLYLGAAEAGPYVLASFNDQLARTGWSWGSAAPDVDNDGDPDLFVANGHRSFQSAKDYCTTFWTHDIYPAPNAPGKSNAQIPNSNGGDLTGARGGPAGPAGGADEDPVLDRFFLNLHSAGAAAGISWNAFEHDVLFLNEGGARFRNVSYLMGTALEEDSRNAVSADFNGDGRLDLAVLAVHRLPEQRVVLHLFQNHWPGGGHWIGVRLAEGKGPGRSPVGATVTLELPGGRRRIAGVVTGDSFRSQHPASVHFGLGSAVSVEAIGVRWPDGGVQRLAAPAINRYHDAKR